MAPSELSRGGKFVKEDIERKKGGIERSPRWEYLMNCFAVHAGTIENRIWQGTFTSEAPAMSDRICDVMLKV